MENVLVFDIGGTQLRSAVIAGETILDLQKHASPSFVEFSSLSGEDLADLLVQKICDRIFAARTLFPGLSNIIIGMPGVVDNTGSIVAAPPLWGDRVKNFPLKREIQKRTNAETTIVNDLCGISFYYASHPEFNKKADYLTLITISTGVGSKTVDIRNQRLLLDSHGTSGEIGHMVIDSSADSAPCDCGGKGHLSSYLSGRGVARFVRQYKNIPDFSHLFPASSSELSDSEILQHLAATFRKGDSRAREIVMIGAEKLAFLMSHYSSFLGVDRYVIVGGLAFALGPTYIDLLKERLSSLHFFGWSKERIEGLIIMGFENDDLGLIGGAKLALSMKKNQGFPL